MNAIGHVHVWKALEGSCPCRYQATGVVVLKKKQRQHVYQRKLISCLQPHQANSKVSADKVCMYMNWKRHKKRYGNLLGMKEQLLLRLCQKP